MRALPGVLAFGLLSLASPAFAADWWFVPQEASPDELVYVDKSSLERPGRGNRTTAWAWTVYQADRPSEKGGYRSEKRHWIVDCEHSQAAADATTRYSAFGGLVSQTRQPVGALAQLQPGSVDEAVSKFMCSAGKQPNLSIPVYDPVKDSEQRFWLKERENAAPAAK